jgi:hypothetical protein
MEDKTTCHSTCLSPFRLYFARNPKIFELLTGGSKKRLLALAWKKKKLPFSQISQAP